MQLGIVTRYAHTEPAYVAIRLANWGRDRGHTVLLHSTLKTAPAVAPVWDAHARNRQPLRERLAGCDTIVWVGALPTMEELAWMQKGGRRAVLFCFWHELDPHDRPVYREVARVLTPSAAAASLLQAKWGLYNISLLPWDTGAPVCNKRGYVSRRLRLLLPLHGYEAYHTEATVLEIIDRQLARFPAWDLVLTHTPSHTASFAKRRVDELAAAHPQQVKVCKSPPYDYLPPLFHSADLTVWPTQQENTGMSGILSLTCGTPTISFALTPITEFAHDDNAVLVPCREEPTPFGVPTAVPQYEAFEVALCDIMSRTDRLGGLQSHASVGMLARRDVFDSILTRAISC